MSTTLDRAALDELEHELRRQGVPAVEHLRPGLNADEIDELVKPLDIRLPEEARIWWSWRDGSSPEVRPRLLPGRSLFSLAGAVAHAEELQDRLRDHRLSDGRPTWSSSWLPIVGGDQLIAIDCRDPVLAPVHVLDFGSLMDAVIEPRASSLSQVVAWWTEALSCGAWHYDAEATKWRVSVRKQPRALTDSWI